MGEEEKNTALTIADASCEHIHASIYHGGYITYINTSGRPEMGEKEKTVAQLIHTY